MKPDPNDRFIREVSRTLKAPNAQMAIDWNGGVQTIPRRRLRAFLAAPAPGREGNDLDHAVRRLDEARLEAGPEAPGGGCVAIP